MSQILTNAIGIIRNIRRKFAMAADCFSKPCITIMVNGHPTIIQDAPNVCIARDIRRRIAASPFLHTIIAERQEVGCYTTRINLTGADAPAPTEPLLSFKGQAFFTRINPETGEATHGKYHVIWSPRAASLILHILAEGESPEKGFVLMVEQFRYSFSQVSREWPGGGNEPGTPLWQTAVEEAKEELIGKERPEAGVLRMLYDYLGSLTEDRVIGLDERPRSLGDVQNTILHRTYSVQAVFPPEICAELRTALHGRRAGVASQLESTTVIAMDLKPALELMLNFSEAQNLSCLMAAEFYRRNLLTHAASSFPLGTPSI